MFFRLLNLLFLGFWVYYFAESIGVPVYAGNYPFIDDFTIMLGVIAYYVIFCLINLICYICFGGHE